MTFGKPRLTNEPVRCINCGEQYPERELTLKHAGRTDDGDFWNSKCPKCNQMDCMNGHYAEMSDEEFREEQHKVERQRREAIRQQKQRR